MCCRYSLAVDNCGSTLERQASGVVKDVQKAAQAGIGGLPTAARTVPLGSLQFSLLHVASWSASLCKAERWKMLADHPLGT